MHVALLNSFALPALLQVGTKLLAADVKIASRLLGKVVHGKTLTRCVRERRPVGGGAGWGRGRS